MMFPVDNAPRGTVICRLDARNTYYLARTGVNWEAFPASPVNHRSITRLAAEKVIDRIADPDDAFDERQRVDELAAAASKLNERLPSGVGVFLADGTAWKVDLNEAARLASHQDLDELLIALRGG